MFCWCPADPARALLVSISRSPLSRSACFVALSVAIFMHAYIIWDAILLVTKYVYLGPVLRR